MARSTITAADRHRIDAARLAPEATEAAGLSAAGEGVTARERRALELVRGGRAADAWHHLQSDNHRRTRDEYAAAVGRFADRVDEGADAELGQVQSEAFWALGSATAVSGLMGLSLVVGWLVGLRRRRPRPGGTA